MTSGEAHCDQELADEVRRGPQRSRLSPVESPARTHCVPRAGRWESGEGFLRSRARRWDPVGKKEEEGGRRRKKEEGGGRRRKKEEGWRRRSRASDIKSNRQVGKKIEKEAYKIRVKKFIAILLGLDFSIRFLLLQQLQRLLQPFPWRHSRHQGRHEWFHQLSLLSHGGTGVKFSALLLFFKEMVMKLCDHWDLRWFKQQIHWIEVDWSTVYRKDFVLGQMAVLLVEFERGTTSDAKTPRGSGDFPSPPICWNWTLAGIFLCFFGRIIYHHLWI